MTVRGGWNMYPVVLDISHVLWHLGPLSMLVAFDIDAERGAETLL